MTSEYYMSAGNSKLESPPKSDEISDFDFVVIDEVDNCKHDSPRPQRKHEPIADTISAQTRKYHRREKKDLALSLLDSFALQSGSSGHGVSGANERVLTTSNSTKSKVLVPTSASHSSAMNPRSSSHSNSVTRNSSTTGTEPTSRSNERLRVKSDASQDKTKSEDCPSKKLQSDRKRKSVAESNDSNKQSDNSTDLLLFEQSDLQEKKQKQGGKMCPKASQSKHKTANKDPVCTDHILSISLPRYNWLEKKLCDPPKEQETSKKDEDDSKDCCMIIEENAEPDEPKATEASKTDEENQTKPHVKDECPPADFNTEVPIDERMDNADRCADRKSSVMKNNQENIDSRRWNEFLMVNEVRHEATSPCQLDLEPIMLPVIDEGSAVNSAFKPSKLYSDESLPEAPEKDDEVILLDITTEKDSGQFCGEDREEQLKPTEEAIPPGTTDTAERNVNGMNIENFSATASSAIDDSAHYDVQESTGIMSSDARMLQMKEIVDITNDTEQGKFFEDRGLNENQDPISTPVFEENNNLRRESSVIDKNVNSDIFNFGSSSSFIQQHQESNDRSISLQHAIHDALYKVIEEESTENVATSTLANYSSSHCHSDSKVTTPSSFTTTCGIQSIKQDQLPPKKRMMNFNKSDESSCSNRSPPLSKRRKLNSIVQKVRPIILNDGDEQKSSKTCAMYDGQTVLIHEDSDDNDASTSTVVDQVSTANDLCALSPVTKMAPLPSDLSNFDHHQKFPKDCTSTVDSKLTSPSELTSVVTTVPQPGEAMCYNSQKSKKKMSRKRSVRCKIPKTYQPQETVISHPSSTNIIASNYVKMPIQVCDGTVAFDEIRALQAPHRKVDEHLVQRVMTKSEGASNPRICVDPTPPTEAGAQPWQLVYDIRRKTKPEMHTAVKSQSAFYFTSYAPTSGVSAYNLPVMSRDTALERMNSSNMVKTTSSSSNAGLFSVQRGSSPNVGHAFHPISPSHQTGRANPAVGRPPSSPNVVSPVLYDPVHQLPVSRQYAKSTDQDPNFALTLQPAPSNYLGTVMYPTTQQTTHQQRNLTVGPYAAQKVLTSAPHSTMTQFHSFTPTTTWYRSNSLNSNSGALSSHQTFHSPEKRLPLNVQKDFRPGTLTTPCSQFLPPPFEAHPTSVPFFDSRFSSSSTGLSHTEYSNNPYTNSKSPHPHWSQSRLKVLQKSSESDNV